MTIHADDDGTTLTATDDAGRAVGTLRWIALPRQPGVRQLLDAEVRSDHRRRGVGSALLAAAVERMPGVRRLTALVNQPDVIARAWLQRGGFVHVHTLDDLHAEHEVMVLVRTFD